MSFPRYPKYKPSGVEWLGDVPDGWAVKRLGYIARSGMGQTILRDMLEVEPSAEALPVYSASEGDEAFGYFLNPAIILQSGDLVVGARGSIGMTRRITTEATCTQTTIWLKPTDTLRHSDFLYWCMVGGREGLFPFDKTAIPMLTVEQVRSGRVPFPPLTEQTAIAEFLDRETGKIDGLVAEQRRLMELLKEKRQAVISHAVTKGLNPHAPMKPSGIEWIGDVPAGWEIRRVSHLFRAAKGKNGQLLTKEFCGSNSGDYPVYSGQTENDGLMGTWDQFEFDFGQDGVLFSTTVGSGKVMTLKHLFGKFSLSQNCMVIWPTSSLCLTRFYFYHFQPLFDVERALIPQHMQASFRMEDLYSYIIAVPPIDEQRAVVSFVETELAKFDTLTAEAERAIDLLQERRTALISAAVTGQIDVRQHPKN